VPAHDGAEKGDSTASATPTTARPEGFAASLAEFADTPPNKMTTARLIASFAKGQVRSLRLNADDEDDEDDKEYSFGEELDPSTIRKVDAKVLADAEKIGHFMKLFEFDRRPKHRISDFKACIGKSIPAVVRLLSPHWRELTIFAVFSISSNSSFPPYPTVTLEKTLAMCDWVYSPCGLV